jgi:competence protein ComEA
MSQPSISRKECLLGQIPRYSCVASCLPSAELLQEIPMSVSRSRFLPLALVVTAFLNLSNGRVAEAQSNPTPSPAAKPAPTISEKIAASKQLLDINTATPDQLKALTGIGDAYVKRIVDGRPYTAKNQLVTRGIIPQDAYDKVKDQIIAHRPKS